MVKVVIGLASRQFTHLLDALAPASVCISRLRASYQLHNSLFLPTDYVNNNPLAFANAYFDFAALRVYQ
jgi:hypothetical protein